LTLETSDDEEAGEKKESSMKAAVLQRRGAEGVSSRDFPDPQPAKDESVLRVIASSLNRVDLYMRDSGVGITTRLAASHGRRGGRGGRRSGTRQRGNRATI
jgi:hypothetical protein